MNTGLYAADPEYHRNSNDIINLANIYGRAEPGVVQKALCI